MSIIKLSNTTWDSKIMTIYWNAMRCENCNTIIESIHRHDYVSCLCEDHDKVIAVDGGDDYLRRAIGTKAFYEDLSLTSEDILPTDRIETYRAVKLEGRTETEENSGRWVLEDN